MQEAKRKEAWRLCLVVYFGILCIYSASATGDAMATVQGWIHSGVMESSWEMQAQYNYPFFGLKTWGGSEIKTTYKKCCDVHFLISVKLLLKTSGREVALFYVPHLKFWYPNWHTTNSSFARKKKGGGGRDRCWWMWKEGEKKALMGSPGETDGTGEK